MTVPESEQFLRHIPKEKLGKFARAIDYNKFKKLKLSYTVIHKEFRLLQVSARCRNFEQWKCVVKILNFEVSKMPDDMRFKTI